MLYSTVQNLQAQMFSKSSDMHLKFQPLKLETQLGTDAPGGDVTVPTSGPFVSLNGDHDCFPSGYTSKPSIKLPRGGPRQNSGYSSAFGDPSKTPHKQV